MNPSFLLLHFLFFINLINAQTPSEYADGRINPSSKDSVSNFQPSLAVVIGMLAIMFSLTFILLLYAKFCHRVADSPATTAHLIHDGLVRSRASVPSGIDKTVVESLPFFRFSSLKGSRQGLECSVCLAKFEDVEVLRLLPKCKHAFHINCIDLWLEKHSTCPLCRRKVGEDDLSHAPYSNSLRFLWNHQTESRDDETTAGVELFVERVESRRQGSSRFGSFRKTEKEETEEEELPIPESMDLEHHESLHRFNHKIVVSDAVLKNRWSNVSSSDLMFLNSEMLSHASSGRFLSLDPANQEKPVVEVRESGEGLMNIKAEMERKRVFESKVREIKGQQMMDVSLELSKAVSQNEKRSMSEIVVHPRFTELRNGDCKDERVRKVWLPIARKTVQWFADRHRRPPQSQGVNV